MDKRRHPSLSELTPIIFDMELNHLDSEGSKLFNTFILVHHSFYFLQFFTANTRQLFSVKNEYKNTQEVTCNVKYQRKITFLF